jgi:hypothetical protein
MNAGLRARRNVDGCRQELEWFPDEPTRWNTVIKLDKMDR